MSKPRSVEDPVGPSSGDEFAEKVAVVTGASTGLGRATALLLASRGADVVLAARNPKPLEAVAENARRFGHRVQVVPTDVANADDRERLVATTLDMFDRVDCLVANATSRDIYLHGSPSDEMKWEEHFRVDVLGAVRLTDAVLPSMRARGCGSIVLVSSISARWAPRGPSGAGYGAMKAALLAAAQMYSGDVARDGIRINALAPGTFFDPDSPIWGTIDDDAKASAVQQIPMGRLGTPTEIAEGVCFLLSDRASWVVGACLVVDGGQFPTVW